MKHGGPRKISLGLVVGIPLVLIAVGCELTNLSPLPPQPTVIAENPVQTPEKSTVTPVTPTPPQSTATPVPPTPTPTPQPKKVIETTFVGEVAGTDALVSLVVNGDVISAYTSGGKETFEELTAWFQGKVADDGSFFLTDSYGTFLEGTVDPSNASGMLITPTGKKLKWGAVEAEHPAAGLFRSESKDGISVLIVNNDLRANGIIRTNFGAVARLSPTRDLAAFRLDRVTTPLDTINVSVLVTTLCSGGFCAFARPPHLVARVRLPIPLVPVAQVPKPKVIVLLTGILTGGIIEPKSNGTHRGTREYYGHDFVQDLLTGGRKNPLTTLSDIQLSSGQSWVNDALGTCGWVAGEDEFDCEPGTEADHFIYASWDPAAREACKTRSTILNSGRQVTCRPPDLTVMTTYRDSTLGLLEQTQRVLPQIDYLYKWYAEAFEIEPELIFVSHSFGGLVGRFMLSNPDPATYVLDALINPERVFFADEQRKQMDFLRDRTLYLITLHTPHEGTPFASRGSEVIDLAFNVIDALETGALIADPVVQQVVNDLRAISDLTGLGGDLLDFDVSLPDLVAALRTFAEESNPDVGQIRDLATDFWAAANSRVLVPSAMRRTSGDVLIPGTEGRLIPVYAFGGRTPGSIIFDTPDPFLLSDNFAAAGRADTHDPNVDNAGSALILIVVDLLLKHLTGDNWGSLVGQGLAGFASDIDRVERSNLRSVSDDATADLNLHPFLPLAGDAVASVLGVPNIRDLSLPIYLKETWDLTLDSGRTLSIDVPVLWCPALDDIVDPDTSDLLIRLEEFPDVTDAILEYMDIKDQTVAQLVAGNLTLADLLRLLQSVGAASVEDFEAVFDVMAEVVELATESISAVKECTNPFNWRLESRQIVVPLPKWIPTGNPVSDGDIDSDGAVPFDSAMGMRLGTNIPLFFDHTRTIQDSVEKTGSWYRYMDSPFNLRNHSVTNNGPAAYLHNEIIRRAGPLARPDGISVYP